MTIKANIRRLKSLRDFLGTVPKERFNLKTWCEMPAPNELIGSTYSDIPQRVLDNTFSSSNKVKTSSCGTTACALGWAAVKPSFRKAGLKFADAHVDGEGKLYGTVYYDYKYGFEAGGTFFGIDEVTSRYLFDPEEYHAKKTIGEVQRRIDVVVRNKGKAPAARYDRDDYYR